MFPQGASFLFSLPHHLRLRYSLATAPSSTSSLMGLEVSNRRWFNSPRGEARFLAHGPAATLGGGLARSREQSSGVLMASCLLLPCSPAHVGFLGNGSRVRGQESEKNTHSCAHCLLGTRSSASGGWVRWQGRALGSPVVTFLSPRPWEERPVTCSLLSLDRGGQGPLLALASWCLQGPQLQERPLVLLLFPPSAVFSFLDLGSFGTGGTLKFPLCPHPGLPQA